MDPVARFRDETWTAGVIGLGYVGLPLSVTAVSAGLPTIGFDVDRHYVEQLAAGHSAVEDVGDEQLRAALTSGLTVTADRQRLSEAEVLFICVPSPLGRNREPDMSYIRSAARTVTEVARPGMLIALESTTYPGTTEEVLVPALQAAGLEVDRDVWVAFSPERVSPGDVLKTPDIPKVVGGITKRSTAVAVAAYSRIVASVHPASSASVAEMSKLLENTYRAVNIGLANEMSQLAHELGIDIWEVIDAADTKPFGFQAFYPGPGVGGHCIPLDPQFLAWRAKEAKFATRFIDLAEQVNSAQPGYTADRIADVLNERRLPVYGTPILGIGIAYKPNVADDRESASIDVLHQLRDRGAEVAVMDPVVGKGRVEEHGFRYIEPDADLTEFALAAVLTDHAVIDLGVVADSVPVVFDARGAFRSRGIDRVNVVAL